MPLQELSPLPPVTGFSQLGQVISNAGERYAQTARQDQLLAQAREQQLADVASQRAERDRTHGVTRGEQLADVKGARAYEDAVAVRKRGEHLEDYGVDFAYKQAAQIAEETRKLATIQPDRENATRLATSYGQQLLAARKSMTDATRVLQSEPPLYTPTSPAVLEEARAMAGTPDKKVIDQMIVPAMDKLNATAAFKHSQATKAAQVTLQMLANTERQLTDMIQTVAQVFKVVPNTPAPPVSQVGGDLGTLTAPQQPMRTAKAADLLAAASIATGGAVKPNALPAPAAPSSPGNTLLDNPTANATIQRGNEELAARAAGQQRAQLNAAIRDGEIIAQQLQEASVPARQPTLGMGITGMAATSYLDPLSNAQATSTLLKAKAANDAKIKQLRTATMGTTAAGVSLPATNTSFSSTPSVDFLPKGDWWKLGQ